jgi:hypothetical protein
VNTGPDDLTSAQQLAAVLSLSVRANGRFSGTLRDGSRLYRFSGFSGLGEAVTRWLNEVLSAPVVSEEPTEPDDEEKPCR